MFFLFRIIYKVKEPQCQALLLFPAFHLSSYKLISNKLKYIMIFCYDAMDECQRSNTPTSTGGSLGLKFSIHGTAHRQRARLAQSVEHQTFNLRVEGSSPSLGALPFTYRDLICAM